MNEVSHEELHADNVRIHARLDKILLAFAGLVGGMVVSGVAATWVLSNTMADQRVDMQSAHELMMKESRAYTDTLNSNNTLLLQETIQLMSEFKTFTYSKVGSLEARVNGNSELIKGLPPDHLILRISTAEERIRDLEKEH